MSSPKVGSTELQVISPESGVIHFNNQGLSEKTTMGRKISNLTPQIGKLIGDGALIVGSAVAISTFIVLLAKGGDPRVALLGLFFGAGSAVLGLKLGSACDDQKQINERLKFLLNKSSIDKDVNQLVDTLKIFKMSSFTPQDLTVKEKTALDLIQAEVDKTFKERISHSYNDLINQSVRSAFEEKNGSWKLGSAADYVSEIVRMSTVVKPQTLQELGAGGKMRLNMLKANLKRLSKVASSAA